MKVKYVKEFISGNLEGSWIDVEVQVSGLDEAANHVRWALLHKTKPCRDYTNGEFLIHMARIESEGGSN